MSVGAMRSVLSVTLISVAILLLTAFILPAAHAQGPTADQIKSILETPIALFVLMLAGSAGSILKKLVVARKTPDQPYVHYWPETVLMLGGNVAGFLVLLMSDQLNFASVILGGYTTNSLASLSRPISLRA